MPVSGIPDLIDRLVTLATPALPTATVEDSVPDLSNEGDFLMVGVDNADLLGTATSAQSVQTVTAASPAHPRDESGTVTLLALSWNGDGDMKAARAAVFAMAAVIGGFVRADASLGLGPPTGSYRMFYVQYGTEHRLLTNRDDNGAEAALVFNLNFTTVV